MSISYKCDICKNEISDNDFDNSMSNTCYNGVTSATLKYFERTGAYNAERIRHICKMCLHDKIIVLMDNRND